MNSADKKCTSTPSEFEQKANTRKQASTEADLESFWTGSKRSKEVYKIQAHMHDINERAIDPSRIC